MLAVPAAALMLGAAQAGTTVGLNFQAWYYDSGATPQTVGFGKGYQTTGFPVTAKAFGVEAANWANTDPLPCQAAIAGSPTFGGTSTNFAGSLSAQLAAANAWQSGIGELNAGWVSEAVAPGDNEVTWGYLDDGNTTGQFPSASVSGLAGLFPNGYVIQTIAANSGVHTFDPVDITDGVSTNTLAYATYFVTNPQSDGYVSGGTVGLSAQSTPFNADTITVSGEPKTASSRSVLCGFIITDKPVVSTKPVGGIYNLGASFSLNAGAIGIAPLSYQWFKDGTLLPGATNLSYSVASAGGGDTGGYTLVATNLYGAGTSVVASVTVLLSPAMLTDISSITNYQTMNALFSPVVGGQTPLGYLWFKNNSPIPGATNASLSLTNLQAGDGASYKLVITNSLGATTSSVAQLTVLSSLPPYEGFAYAAGSVTGQSGGVGWTGSWTQETNGYNGDHAVFTPATPWRGGVSELVSTGGALLLAAEGSADFDDIRNLQTTLGGGASGPGTVYISFVAQITNTGWGGIELVQDGNGQVLLGANWYANPWGWGDRGDFNSQCGHSTSPCTTEAFLVYRFDFNSTNEVVRLYVDPPMSAEPATPSVSGTWSAFTFDQIRIVSHTPASATGGNDGMVDEFRMGGTWASVTPHIPRTDAPFALQVIPGGVIKDTKPIGTPHPGQGYNLTWLGSVTDANTPPVTRTGVEVFSNSPGSQIITPTNADFNTAYGTICFWMTATAPLPGGGSEGAMLVDRRTTTGAVIVLHDDGSIFWQGQVGSQNAFSAGYIPDGNWHHVAVTYGQTTSDTISIYVDGALAGSVPVTNSWSWPTNQEIEIGQSHDPYWMKFDGQMDDFRIYNRVLNATEVGQVYASDALVDTNALTVRYNFDSAIYGNSLVWPFGTLQTSPALGNAAAWTTITNAVSPYPLLLSAPAAFYRLFATP